ncbi:GNAT family N-acetyltransferase [bacterium]|nr:GNAT family N-acetyltransferase [bacterium]
MLEIKKYITEQLDLWEKIVKNANNGTLFHTRKFLSYHPPGRFIDHSLIIYKKDKPYILFPAAEREINGKRFLVSHPGTSYGSFVVPAELPFADSYKIVESLIKYAKSHKFNGIRLTPPPTIYNRRLSNYIDFALLQHGFTYHKREISSILFLENKVEQNLEKFKASHQRAVRKAIKEGVEIRESDQLEEFYQILKNNLKIRHNVTPTHTLDELLKLKELFPNEIKLFGAFLNNKMVAGVVNFTCTKDVVLAFYISHDEKYQETRALNLLFYSIFDWAIKNELKVFDFGIFTVNEDPNFGLARFKENFGASGMFRDTFEIIL